MLVLDANHYRSTQSSGRRRVAEAGACNRHSHSRFRVFADICAPITADFTS
jgi:hypothetical protein